MDMKNMKALFVVLLALMLLTTACSETFTQEQVDARLKQEANALETTYNSEKQTLQSELDTLVIDKGLLEDEKTALETQVAELEAIPEEEPEAEEVPEAPFYLFDDVALDGTFEGTVDNDDLETLFYGEIDYNGDDYDAEELLTFSAEFLPVLNVEDFGSDIAIEVDSEGFLYELSFNDPILLVEGEDLIITFLGRELTIVETGNNEITYRTSQKVRLSLNDVYEYDGSVITLVGFNDGNEDEVLLLVDDVLVQLEEGDTKRIGDLKISVEDIFLSTIGNYNSVVLYVGEDITETVSDREEFEDDDRYDWIVKSDDDGLSKLGLTLIEKYTEEDEVLALGDSLSLPYDYKTVTFYALKNLDVTDVRISVRTDEIRVKSDGKIEIAGKKIDDGEFTLNDEGLVEYEYKGDDRTTEVLTDIVLFFGDREVEFDSDLDSFSLGDYEFGYAFGVKEITSAPGEANEDEDYRLVSGDILYQTDANEDDEEETSVTIGFVDITEDQEVILKVV